MKELEILSVTTNLSRYGGAQKVMLDVHNGIKAVYSSKILGFQSFEKLHDKFNISREEYVQFKHPLQLNNKIVIVHARNIIPLIVALKKVFFLNTKIIYVSHNVYNTYSRLTIFPDNVVSISKKVTENLINYFSIDPKKITFIYNGIDDRSSDNIVHNYKADGVLKILYPARINSVKRQFEIVNNLAGKLHPKIEIHFAGIGSDYEKLKQACGRYPNFKTLGFIENMHSVIPSYDYLMLYSVQEGLPIALIEGIMHGKPLIINDVGGNTEIGQPSENGILLSDEWSELGGTLNRLLDLSESRYMEMSKSSRLRYKKMFQLQAMILKYTDLIKKI